MARLPAALSVVTPAGRSMLLLAVVAYLVDTFGGWPVFQLVWVSCLMMLLVAVVLAVLPVRAVVELGVSPRRTVAGEGATVLVEARSASRLPVPGPLLDVPVGGAHVPPAPPGAVRVGRAAVAEVLALAPVQLVVPALVAGTGPVRDLVVAQPGRGEQLVGELVLRRLPVVVGMPGRVVGEGCAGLHGEAVRAHVRRVELEHRGWERLGAVAGERRDRNRRGWAGVTQHYRALADS